VRQFLEVGEQTGRGTSGKNREAGFSYKEKLKGGWMRSQNIPQLIDSESKQRPPTRQFRARVQPPEKIHAMSVPRMDNHFEDSPLYPPYRHVHEQVG